MASTLTDEERRKLLKPKVTPEEALSVLYEFYTSEGQQPEVARELDSYDDVNFLVKIDGEKALLKIHNGVESEKYIRVHSAKKAKLNDGDVAAGEGSIIDLHTAVFEHLAKPEFKVTTCKTIPSNKSQEDGDNSVCIKELPVVSSEHSPQKLVIRLCTWVHGVPLSSTKYFPLEVLVDAGAYLGRMCHALDDLAASDAATLELSKRYHAWDGRNLLDAMRFVEHIDDPHRRNLVTSVIDTFRKVILEGGNGDKFRMAINHGDFNDANIIVGDDDQTGMSVTGAIDFGDTVYSWRVLDATTAMAYALITSYGKKNRSISAACALLRGFHYSYHLTADERKHLRLLTAGRLALSVTFGNYSYKQNPGNEYLLLHAKPAWDALDLIWGQDGKGAGGTAGDAIDNAFRIACENVQVLEGENSPDCFDISFPDPSVTDPLSSAR